mgnify:CR=1 FL=1
MNKPVLVVMAAGMGSRYGGMKQIDPVGPCGQVIVDYSLYDARRAGFETVIFVIKHEIEDAFKAAIGERVSKAMDVKYAFQQLDELPEGYTIPEGRVKPWGTCHAVLAAKPYIHGPFAVINADDYYGKSIYREIHDYLCTDHPENAFCMAGFILKNTLSDNGTVTRGICQVDGKGFLTDVVETKNIRPTANGAEADGKALDPDGYVSMNMWGFTKSILEEIKAGFPAFLDKGLKENPMKCEYFLPTVVSNLLAEDKATVSVLKSADKWYGVTYKEDKPVVVAAIQRMKDEGLYPQHLWEGK